ncbi:hypothetical protein CFO_g3582 [Ceratocystis platani]|uniref:Uncharacterized protein n=1 Tax=Ceratocystis fimbriata f. sp. platani TaxID=88771 RepID=A0A0F8DDL9_CERFI|nr:hypothetical protein CFO_g3582 [Ceratocystis platani]
MEYNRLDPRTIFSWAPFDLGLSLDFLEPELRFLVSGNANLAPEEVALRVEMAENLIEFLRADPPTSIWDDEVPYDHNEMDAESNLEVRHPYHHLLMSLASAQKRLTHSSALLDQPWANRFKVGDFQPWDNIYFLFLYLNGADVVRPLAQADKIRMQLRCRIRPSISKVPAKILELLTSFQTALILGPYTTAVPCPCDKVSKQGRGRFCDHMQQHMRKHRPYVMEMYNDVWSKPVDSQTNGYFTFAECKLLQEAGVGVQPSPKHLFAKEQDPIAAKATKTGKCKKSKSKGCNSRKRKFSQSPAPLAAQPAGNISASQWIIDEQKFMIFKLLKANKTFPEEVAAAIAVTKARRALGEATAAALSARKAALLGIEHAKNARYQESAADILARRDNTMGFNIIQEHTMLEEAAPEKKRT